MDHSNFPNGLDESDEELRAILEAKASGMRMIQETAEGKWREIFGSKLLAIFLAAEYALFHREDAILLQNILEEAVCLAMAYAGTNRESELRAYLDVLLGPLGYKIGDFDPVIFKQDAYGKSYVRSMYCSIGETNAEIREIMSNKKPRKQRSPRKSSFSS
jgi:hypothetical protein